MRARPGRTRLHRRLSSARASSESGSHRARPYLATRCVLYYVIRQRALKVRLKPVGWVISCSCPATIFPSEGQKPLLASRRVLRYPSARFSCPVKASRLLCSSRCINRLGSEAPSSTIASMQPSVGLICFGVRRLYSVLRSRGRNVVSRCAEMRAQARRCGGWVAKNRGARGAANSCAGVALRVFRSIRCAGVAFGSSERCGWFAWAAGGASRHYITSSRRIIGN